jgi:SAM-dependent methyltransferase
MGSAGVQGALWGTAPRDWAEVCEALTRPLYVATVAALRPLSGLASLDVGCGTGLALRLAADDGATVTGLDASAPMLDVARERLPEADLRVGDIQELPFDDSTFDVVTAFNVVQYAADPTSAAGELARVVRPGGRVAIGVWGDPARCETEVVFQRIRALAPPPPGTPAPLAVSAPGVVEELLTGAGLLLSASGEVGCPFSYRDLETAWRGHSAAGPVRKAIEIVGEAPVREAFLDAHGPYRQPDSSYRQDNEFRYVIAGKPA